jgi:hypothetical protein
MDQSEKEKRRARLKAHIEHNLKLLSEETSDWNEEQLLMFPCPGLRLRLPEGSPPDSEEK